MNKIESAGANAKTGISRKSLLGYGLALAAALVLPMIVRGAYHQHVLVMILIWTIAGTGWNILGGYAGQVSIGHSVFYGIGAYSVAIGYKYFGMTPWLTMWIGVLVSIVMAFIIGMPLLRLKGPYFSIATMATVEACRVVFINWQSIGGATGINFVDSNASPWYSMQFPSKLYYYYIALAFVVVVLALNIYLDRSKFGYYLRTIKGNELAAESIGIDTALYKNLAFMLSAVIVSLAGSLYAQYMLYIDPTMLMIMKISLMMALVTVMGGSGTVFGPFLGAIALTCISEYTRAWTGGSGYGLDQIIYGLLVVVIVLFLPGGLISLIKKGVARLRKQREG